jgi:hypothetical protein
VDEVTVSAASIAAANVVAHAIVDYLRDHDVERDAPDLAQAVFNAFPVMRVAERMVGNVGTVSFVLELPVAVRVVPTREREAQVPASRKRPRGSNPRGGWASLG